MKCSFTKEVLIRLQNGQKVSALTAARWGENASTKLTSRCADLRAKGYKIKGAWIKTKSGKRYMSYSLEGTK